jgi:hypothetical protein
MLSAVLAYYTLFAVGMQSNKGIILNYYYYYYFLHVVQTGSEVHITFSPIGTGSCFLGGKAAGA